MEVMPAMNLAENTLLSSVQWPRRAELKLILLSLEFSKFCFMLEGYIFLTIFSSAEKDAANLACLFMQNK
jgi:hypothetical protein